MDSRQRCRLIQICILLCGCLPRTSTEAANASPTNEEGVSSPAPSRGATPGPGLTGTADVTSVVTTDALDSMATTSASDVPTVPAATTEQPAVTPEACLCDLTPGFCDIGCCCDSADCGAADLSTIFSGCPQQAIPGVCIERWLMFRANVDSSLVTVTDSMFCVQSADNVLRTPAAPLRFPPVGDSFHFSPPQAKSIGHGRDFYRADDVIQTYFSSSSARGLLRLPSPGAAAAFCVTRNPAKFLRSESQSCTRALSPRSCSTDPSLNARSYFSDLSLMKIPVVETAQVSDFLIPVTPLSDWPPPSERNNTCVNVAEKVEFVIGYTGRGEITHATVNVVLADVDSNQPLLQTHSVKFQRAASSSTPGDPAPAAGLRAGSPVIGRFNETVKALTTLGVSRGGACSSNPLARANILFARNSITGCTFSSPSSNCSDLRSQMHRVFLEHSTPDVIAMNSGSKPDWTRVLTQQCPDSVQETCESGCFLPYSLSVRVLWARQGPLDSPQSFILGAKYVFHCRTLKCPVSSPVALTTEVTFADTTVYPEPPRGLPQPDWKLPFGFFTRGPAELDGHTLNNGRDAERVTWSLMLLTAMLLTGLEFFTR